MEKEVKIDKKHEIGTEEICCKIYECPNCKGDIFEESNYCMDCGIRIIWDINSNNKSTKYEADEILNKHYEENVNNKCIGIWSDKPIIECTREQLLAIIDMEGRRQFEYQEELSRQKSILGM